MTRNLKMLVAAIAACLLCGYTPNASTPPQTVQQLQAQVQALQSQAGTPYTDAQARAAAPVQTVNGMTGNPVVPAYQRQKSGAMTVSTTDGTVTWAFPVAFNNQPTCYVDLGTTTSGYTFDYPVRTAVSLTSITYQITTHPKSLQIASLSPLPIVLTITPAGAPAGTTATLTCWAVQ